MVSRRAPASSARLSTTVVIPTYEPGPELAEVLDRLVGQESSGPVEILVIDSSSRDGTVELLEERNIRHLVIPKREFNHGITRNLGVRHATGEIVAFLSQDALPLPGWLNGLVNAFEDPEVAGAYSRQIPRPDASPFAADQLFHWPASALEPRRQVMPHRDEFRAMTPSEKLATVCFDDVSSAVRRSVALEIPFRKLSFGEDRDWAYRVLVAGHAIEYSPGSQVIHSHNRSPWYELRRTVSDHRLLWELLGPGEVPRMREWLPAARNEILRLLDVSSRADSPGRRMKARLSAPLRALAGAGGGYLGAQLVGRTAAGSRSWLWLGKHLTRGV